MGADTRSGRSGGAGQGSADGAALAARLDRLEATVGDTLGVVRAILAVVAAEPDDGRPRLDELLAEIVALQRDTLRVVGENAAALRRICAALPPQGVAGADGAGPDGGHAGAGAGRGER